MGRLLAFVSIALFVFPCRVATGARWYVDGSVSESGDGTSWETAFKRIQEGIDAAGEGDTVVVAEGTYVENIRYEGKNIVLTSTDPFDPEVAAKTIIDGNEAGSVVTFSGTEGEGCVLSGFTIRNGLSQDGAGVHGGTWSTHTRATIERNTVSGNSATSEGGGVAFCDGEISSNTITENHGHEGGGLYHCDGLIRNNTVAGNTSVIDGGGFFACAGRIEENVISGNSTEHNGGGLFGCDGTVQNNVICTNSAGRSGGGLALCDGTIQNNSIFSNTADNQGGGLWDCDGTVQNNTVVGNRALSGGGGLCGCRGAIRNCIVWDNESGVGEAQIQDSNRPSFCSIQGWAETGAETVTGDPLFADPEHNDYHLQGESPCIDAGVGYYWFAWPQRDLDSNCRLAGSGVDLGCYEYGSFADSDGDLLSDEDESMRGTKGLTADSDNDGLRDGLEVLRGSNPLAATSPRLVRVSSELHSIQQALCLAVNGEEIVVSPGRYKGTVQLCGADVILRGTDPESDVAVTSTILDGDGGGPVVFLAGSESEECVLMGFTVTHGEGCKGGGIRGGTPDRHSRATIVRNRIEGNWAEWYGGGLAFCDGVISDNRIAENSTGHGGGGLYLCNGTVTNNAITGNEAGNLGGGGLIYCQGRIEGNFVGANSADSSGGGLAHCHGRIRDNVITGNQADAGGGGGLYRCGGAIQNNIITENVAVGHGGGLDWCDGVIENNTIVGNRAGVHGGGLNSCYRTIRNCIIWGNINGQVWSSGTPSYSCIQGWTFVGEGNIAENPRFVDAPNGDCRLVPSSPCIDAGFNHPDLPELDIRGMHRIMYGGKSPTVDMGAYEYYVNEIEVGEEGDVTLTWSSLAGKAYTVCFSSDMVTWEVAAEGVPSLSDTVTTWLDSSGAILSHGVAGRFYKIEEIE